MVTSYINFFLQKPVGLVGELNLEVLKNSHCIVADQLPTWEPMDYIVGTAAKTRPGATLSKKKGRIPSVCELNGYFWIVVTESIWIPPLLVIFHTDYIRHMFLSEVF